MHLGISLKTWFREWRKITLIIYEYSRLLNNVQTMEILLAILLAVAVACFQSYTKVATA
jgi:hypothetical protein